MIGMVGSAQFAGWMVSSLFIPRLGDLYGRKKPFYISIVAATIIQGSILFTTNLSLMILMFFLLGLTQAGKFSLNHVYLQELMPVKYRTTAAMIG